MLVYNYHPITLEYTGCSEADPDPLDEGRWLIPACASTIAPPEAVSGKIRVFMNGAWAFEDICESPTLATEIEDTAEQKRINEILTQLESIDLQSIRPLRAIASGTQTTIDLVRLNTLDAQAQLLRDELALISASV